MQYMPVEWSKRTHMCGNLTIADEGESVVLNGWVHRRRDHGGLIFIDLRDVSGVVQLVFNPQTSDRAHREAEKLRAEFVLFVRGTVSKRPDDAINKDLQTGEIEVSAVEAAIISESKTPPFETEDDIKVDEHLRLKYRYLDLRRSSMRDAMTMRAKAAWTVREYLSSRDYLEIETPMLTNSTPEGARDFIVPSRLQPGRFFALPQSPQLFKQILMIAGFDKYYQIVRCFRDEDLRADRQPEFTQIDVEMSFVDSDSILREMEAMIKHLFGEVAGNEIQIPLKRIDYEELMDLYGSDRPDRRCGMEISDITDVFKNTDFRVFRSIISSGGRIRGFKVKDVKKPPRQKLDALVDYAVSLGAKGLIWMLIEDGMPKSPISKNLSDDEKKSIMRSFSAEEGDVLVIAGGRLQWLRSFLGTMRAHVIEYFDVKAEDKTDIFWVVRFPLFDTDEETGELKSNHHPFTRPTDDTIELLFTDPSSVLSDSYDMVMNGNELGGGSMRIHERKVQEKVFEILDINPEQADQKFGFLLEALDFGAPPHGGLAFGFDRLMMLMLGLDSIRDSIAFPKTQSGACPMTGAPSAVYPEQLKELGIRSI